MNCIDTNYLCKVDTVLYHVFSRKEMIIIKGLCAWSDMVVGSGLQ